MKFDLQMRRFADVCETTDEEEALESAWEVDFLLRTVGLSRECLSRDAA